LDGHHVLQPRDISHAERRGRSSTDDKINALKRAPSEIADRPLSLSQHIISNATACQHSGKIRAGQAACINRLSGEIRGGSEITRLRGASPAFNKSSASTVREASGNIWEIAARV
jgi:hypothetical protein